MSTDRPSPSAARLLLGQLGYHVRVNARSRVGVFFVFLLPLMLLFALNLLHQGDTVDSRGGIRFVQFVVPAVMAFATVNVCYAITITSAALAREEGVLKRLRGTPLPPWVYIAGYVLSAGVLTLVAVVAALLLGVAVYDVEVVWDGLPVAVLTLIVGIGSFTALAFAVASRVPSADAAFPVAWGTLLPVCFVSNIFIPLDNAPGWLSTLASALPVKPFADALSDAFNPTLAQGPSRGRLAVVAVWGLASALVAPRVFSWEAHVPRRLRRLSASRG